MDNITNAITDLIKNKDGFKITFEGVDILIIAIFVLGMIAFAIWQFMITKKKEMVKQRKGILYQIKPGLEVLYRKGEKKIRMERLLEHFTGSVGNFLQTLQIVEPTFSFEIHANGIGGYGTYIWVPESAAQYLPATMRSLYEQPLIVKEEDEPMGVLHEKISDDKGYAKVKGFFTAEYQLAGSSSMSIKEWFPDKGEPDDPMEQIFGIFDGLRGNNIAGLMVTIKHTNTKWKENIMSEIQNMQYDMPGKPGFFDFLKPGPTPQEQQQSVKRKQLDTFQKNQLNTMIEKAKKDGFAAVVRIYSSDESTFQLLCNAVEKRFKGDYNQLVKSSDNVSLEEMKLRWFEKSNMVLSLGEIASIFHFADSETKAERLQRGGSSTAAPDENLAILKEEEDYDPFQEINKI